MPVNQHVLDEFEGLHRLDRLTYKGEEGLRALKAPIAELLADLRQLSLDAADESKVKLVKRCVEKLNKLNEEWDGDLLSTDEREEIIPLLDAIAKKVGLRPYEDGFHGEWLPDWYEF
jgi:hypothetical protein